MFRNHCSIFAVSYVLLLVISLLGFCFASGNPIPVYPDPEPELVGISSSISVPIIWIFFVFIIDFFIDILIVYAGLYLLDRSNLLGNRNVLDFSKKTFLFAVVLISLSGLISELVFGAWIGGAILALFLIFISFVLVSRYILVINWSNSYRMGLFAVIINGIVWIFIFSL